LRRRPNPRAGAVKPWPFTLVGIGLPGESAGGGAAQERRRSGQPRAATPFAAPTQLLVLGKWADL